MIKKDTSNTTAKLLYRLKVKTKLPVSKIVFYFAVLWTQIPNTLNLDSDPGFWPNLRIWIRIKGDVTNCEEQKMLKVVSKENNFCKQTPL